MVEPGESNGIAPQWISGACVLWIQQLIAAGLLKAEKRAGAWFIDAASVEERKRKTEGA